MNDRDFYAQMLDMQRQQTALLRAIAKAVGVAVEPCPSCGSVDLEAREDTSTMGAPRHTCRLCGKSWNPEQQEIT